FQVPVRLRFPLNERLRPGASLDLHIFNAASQQYESSEFVALVDPSGWTASAEVSYFTQFAVTTSAATAGPQITSLTPSSAPIGATITISGSGFSTNLNQNNVLFSSSKGNGTINATVLTAKESTLTVTVPVGAITGPVSVKISSVKSNTLNF